MWEQKRGVVVARAKLQDNGMALADGPETRRRAGGQAHMHRSS